MPVIWDDVNEATNWMKLVDTMFGQRPDLNAEQIFTEADKFTKAARDRRPSLIPALSGPKGH